MSLLNSIHSLSIDRIAFGGKGVGRIDGKACFVPLSAPGDLASVRITKDHRSYCEAQIVELLKPSTRRTTPLCPAFGICGGCDWQHIDYDLQVEAKSAILRETLQRVGRLDFPNVSKTKAATAPYRYRARAQFKLFMASDGLKAGFYRKGSRFVIDLPNGCPVVTDSVNGAFFRLRSILESFTDLARIPQISIEEGIDGPAAVVHYIGNETEYLAAFLQKESDNLNLSGLFLQTGRKDAIRRIYGSDCIRYAVPSSSGDMDLGYGIGGFSQVNRDQNRTLISQAADFIEGAKVGRLLDLYCGNGNFSIPLAKLAEHVTGVEEYSQSISSAVDNSRRAHVKNSTFIVADAAEELIRLADAGEVFDTILLDPPREGASRVAENLHRLGARRLIYISCDPGTLARDLSILVTRGGYSLKEVVPVDMFPQTGHIEAVAFLKKD